jgi:coiled-coil domain-containing protein 12
MEDAADRRARLKAIREAAAATGEAPGAGGDQPAAEPEKPALKFRNYAVKDENRIQHEKVRGWFFLLGGGAGLCMQWRAGRRI